MLDIKNFTFDISDINQHIQTPDQRNGESEYGQRKVLKLWEKYKAQLAERTTWDAERVDQFQFDRIRQLVDDAFSRHPFYNRIYSAAGYQSGDITSWDDYRELPVISKDDIVAHFDEFRSGLLVPDDQRYLSTTSGSSGKVLTILQDESTNQMGYLYYFRHYEQMLGRAREGLDWLYEIYLCPQRYTSFDGNFPVFTVSQNCPVEAVTQHMRLLRPTLLTGFPSYFLRMVDSGFDCSMFGLAAISTNSEASSRGERDKIADAFNAPVMDEYSSEELYLIATECREGNYHLVQDNVRVDIENADASGLGDVVATSLTNTYMPFIRYRQGDIGKLAEPTLRCSCSNGFHILEKFHGRADQTLVRADGVSIGPDRVMGVYDETILTPESGIAQFHILQDSHQHLTLYLEERPERAINESRLHLFLAGLRSLFDGDVSITTKSYSEMPPALSHKRRVITSNVKVHDFRHSIFR